MVRQMKLNLCVPSFLQNTLLCVMVSLLLAVADQIQPQYKIAYPGENVQLNCEGRFVSWFYDENQDNTPDTSQTAVLIHDHDKVLSFRARERDTGYYWCHGKFPQQDRYFLSRARVQVVNGKL